MRALCLGVLVSALVALCVLAQEPPKGKRSAAELMDAIMWNREPIGGPFRLTDHQGRTRRDTDFRGKLMLVYFGYTTCPDVCPTDLQQIGLALEMLGDAAKNIAPIFITLDPKRDTRQLLSQYVPVFHPLLVGLTGSEADIDKVSRAYRVYSEKVPVSGWLRYTVDHSSFIYLMGADGRYLGFLPPGTPADRMVDVIKPHLANKR
jgi:protein SCO1/2